MTELQWRPHIYLPVNLTVRFGVQALAGSDPAGWCQRKAAELLGAKAKRGQIDKLSRWLEEYLADFRSGQLPATAAVFFYPDFLHPRALATIHLVGPDPVIGPMTMARAREIYQPDEYSFGDQEVSEINVPTGPALRIHRFRKADPMERRSRIAEEVAWVICPPRTTQAVMMSTMWMESGFTKPGTTIADDMARNFRIEPLGEGDE